MSKNEIGVIIDKGPQNWQIAQQNARGTADISLSGRWLTQDPHKTAAVMARVVWEHDQHAVTLALDWQAAAMEPGNKWSIVLRDIPRGGLYRIETCLQLDGSPVAPVEWAHRGDMIHFLGVGDVWVIAGQSNAAGYGRSPVTDGPELGVHMFHAGGQWRLAAHPLDDATGTRYPDNREGANPSHSPFLAFARKLKAALGYPIGLIPTALGGSPLSSWLRKADGRLFANMLSYLRDAGSGCRGMLWYQGCSDTGPDDSKTYLERFTDFITDLRQALKSPSFPVITAQLNRYVGVPYGDACHAGWEAIREAQRQAARKMPGVYAIATLDLGLSDGIHNSSAGNLVIGERMADVALGALHGRGVKYLHPDLAEARRVGSKTIELVFDNVDTRLQYENNIPEQFPFAVRDAAGDVPVAAWSIPDKNVFRIELGRALQQNATVTGAPTACPPPLVPVDISGYRPMLAFTAPVLQT